MPAKNVPLCTCATMPLVGGQGQGGRERPQEGLEDPVACWSNSIAPTTLASGPVGAWRGLVPHGAGFSGPMRPPHPSPLTPDKDPIPTAPSPDKPQAPPCLSLTSDSPVTVCPAPLPADMQHRPICCTFISRINSYQINLTGFQPLMGSRGGRPLTENAGPMLSVRVTLGPSPPSPPQLLRLSPLVDPGPSPPDEK